MLERSLVRIGEVEERCVCVCVRENVSEAARLCLCLQAGSNDDDAAQGLDVGPRTRRCRLRGDELAAATHPTALGAIYGGLNGAQEGAVPSRVVWCLCTHRLSITHTQISQHCTHLVVTNHIGALFDVTRAHMGSLWGSATRTTEAT